MCTFANRLVFRKERQRDITPTKLQVALVAANWSKERRWQCGLKTRAKIFNFLSLMESNPPRPLCSRIVTKVFEESSRRRQAWKVGRKKKNMEEQDEGIDLCVSPVIACFILIRVHTVAAAVTSSNVSRLIKATLLLARSISPPSPPSAIFFFISFPLELFICPPRALIFAVCPPLFLSIGESQRKRKNWRKENKEIN